MLQDPSESESRCSKVERSKIRYVCVPVGETGRYGSIIQLRS